jgi:hypothetical protein
MLNTRWDFKLLPQVTRFTYLVFVIADSLANKTSSMEFFVSEFAVFSILLSTDQSEIRRQEAEIQAPIQNEMCLNPFP